MSYARPPEAGTERGGDGPAPRWPIPAAGHVQPPEPGPGHGTSAIRRRGGAAPAVRLLRPSRAGDETWAMIGYLAVPFVSFLPALVIYLLKMRSSGFVRAHAAQALNFGITLLLYGICTLIVGGLLAFDSATAALAVAGPVAAGLWLAALAFGLRATAAAGRGGFAGIPGWLCATIVRV